MRGEHWSAEDREKLLKLVEENGTPTGQPTDNYWMSISKKMGNRTNNACYQRWLKIDQGGLGNAPAPAPAPALAPTPAADPQTLSATVAGAGPQPNEEWSAELTDEKIGNGAYAAGYRIKRDANNNYYGKENGVFKKMSIKRQKELWERGGGASMHIDLETNSVGGGSRSPEPEEQEEPQPPSVGEPEEGLLVFLGDSNCRALSTGQYQENAHTTEWCSLFGREGKMPAINGGVNGAVYGLNDSPNDLRRYIGPKKRAVPSGESFKGLATARAAMRRSPRGVVFFGWKNHIGIDAQGGRHMKRAIMTMCNLLINDVRKYTADYPHLPIYLLEVYQPGKQPAVDAVNDAIKEAAKARDDVFVVKLASLDHLQNRHASGQDNLHLTPEGYKEVLRLIACMVDAVEQRTQPASAAAASSSAADADDSAKALLEERSKKRKLVDAKIQQIADKQSELNQQEREQRVRQLQEELKAAERHREDGRKAWESFETEKTKLTEKRRKLLGDEEKAKKAVRAEAVAKKALKAAQAGTSDGDESD